MRVITGTLPRPKPPILLFAVSFTKFFTTLGFLKMCGLCVCCCSVWLIQFEMYNVSARDPSFLVATGLKV